MKTLQDGYLHVVEYTKEYNGALDCFEHYYTIEDLYVTDETVVDYFQDVEIIEGDIYYLNNIEYVY